jgi:hypothetical protein
MGAHFPSLFREKGFINREPNLHVLNHPSSSSSSSKNRPVFLVTAMAPQKLKIGVAGLGRMGKRHALNFFQSVPRAELVAVSSPDPVERQWAEENLNDVTVYENYDDMLRREGLEAVCVASATAVHASQTIDAIQAGKHVLCEKPLATTAEVVSWPVSVATVTHQLTTDDSHKQLSTPLPDDLT